MRESGSASIERCVISPFDGDKQYMYVHVVMWTSHRSWEIAQNAQTVHSGTPLPKLPGNEANRATYTYMYSSWVDQTPQPWTEGVVVYTLCTLTVYTKL